ncbi:hypothetical protein SF123566_7834 [Shigella flexneri 1235-66]|nr:hypothetical protein SF123566_7834 [Shigella flexneri 1235-66]
MPIAIFGNSVLCYLKIFNRLPDIRGKTNIWGRALFIAI